MSILNDKEILRLCKEENMITPFSDSSVKQVDGIKLISYGMGSFGYDIRLSGEDLKLFLNRGGEVVDPRNVKPEYYVVPEIKYDETDGAAYVVLPPNTGLLGHSLERFKMPRDVLAQALGKSTYARCFISVIVTPLEPEWEGDLVIEVVNHGSHPARVYLNQGICQLLFLRGEQPNVSYKDKGGKYQGQSGTQDALV